jgi:hypothetical protein
VLQQCTIACEIRSKLSRQAHSFHTFDRCKREAGRSMNRAFEGSQTPLTRFNRLARCNMMTSLGREPFEAREEAMHG